LPTGSTPIPTYKELVRMHKEEELSFKNVTSFNLDEYAFLFSIKHHIGTSDFQKITQKATTTL
jgi:glucosamine-6-phosphate deaminase